MNDNLTERQRQVLTFVRTYVAANGWAPSIREICRGVGLATPSAVVWQLDHLQAKGYLRRGQGARAIALTEPATPR